MIHNYISFSMIYNNENHTFHLEFSHDLVLREE